MFSDGLFLPGVLNGIGLAKEVQDPLSINECAASMVKFGLETSQSSTRNEMNNSVEQTFSHSSFVLNITWAISGMSMSMMLGAIRTIGPCCS